MRKRNKTYSLILFSKTKKSFFFVNFQGLKNRVKSHKNGKRNHCKIGFTI